MFYNVLLYKPSGENAEAVMFSSSEIDFTHRNY